MKINKKLDELERLILHHTVTLTTQDIRRLAMSSERGSTGRGRGRRSRGGHEETNGGPSTSSGAAPVPETPLPVPSATKSSSTKSIKPTGTSLKRIQKELAEITLDPPPNCSAGPKNDNMYEWVSTILGPPGSVYEGACSSWIYIFPQIIHSNHQKLHSGLVFTIATLTTVIPPTHWWEASLHSTYRIGQSMIESPDSGRNDLLQDCNGLLAFRKMSE
ncbi:UBE2E [Mytilus coruscus]|uniref:UBE2E n=1 Tax=Mytilus coruscus TaxID=42192 RepID=A0A6J8E6L6_MYTCO|nr:UBE2E [Mytilus coruscus]